MAINAYGGGDKGEGLSKLLAVVNTLSNMGILAGDTKNKAPLYEQQTIEAKAKNAETDRSNDVTSPQSLLMQESAAQRAGQNASVDKVSKQNQIALIDLIRKGSASDIEKFNKGNTANEFALQKIIKPQSTENSELKEIKLQLARGALENQQKPKFTEEQGKSAGYADRMELAQASLGELDKKKFDPTTWGTELQGNKYYPERAKSGDFKTFENNKSNFISAVLRKESGAVISDEEFSREDKKYFGQPGDSKQNLLQKANLRALATRNMIRSAATAYNVKSAQPGMNQIADKGGSTNPLQISPGINAAQDDGAKEQPVKKLYNSKLNKTRFVYSDGRTEEVNGKQ